MVLRIGPTLVPVLEASPQHLGQDVLGLWEGCPKARILLRDDLEDPMRRQTLLHEALHAIDEMYGLSLGESRIRVLEQVLTGLVQDNRHAELF